MLLKTLGFFILSTQLVFAASIPKECPHTRNCNNDVDCRIYGAKHNCHSVCVRKTLTDQQKHQYACPQQCLCGQEEKSYFFGLPLPEKK